jgi:hypothetical protein
LGATIRRRKPKQENEMKRSIAVAAMLFMMPVAAGAQDAIPTLKGPWRGLEKFSYSGPTCFMMDRVKN